MLGGTVCLDYCLLPASQTRVHTLFVLPIYHADRAVFKPRARPTREGVGEDAVYPATEKELAPSYSPPGSFGKNDERQTPGKD